MDSKPLSLRLPSETRSWLQRFSRGRATLSSMAARLLEEARRRTIFPGISFTDTPNGRRAIVEGSDILVATVWQFQQTTAADAITLTDHFGWSLQQSIAAISYSNAFPNEVAADASDILPTLQPRSPRSSDPAAPAVPLPDPTPSVRISHPFSSLIEAAKEARLLAHAPYSRFKVGAALLGKGWKLFKGCNVENLSYGLTICAERNAIFQAIASGVSQFEAIAIVADTRHPISPCGACRQVMAEFGNFRILSATLSGEVFESTVDTLLPRSHTGILDLD